MADGPLMTTGGGYTCAVCGIFVPSGTTHFCYGSPYQRAAEVKWDRMSDVRIADALERIAGCLAEVADLLHKSVLAGVEVENLAALESDTDTKRDE